MGESNYLAITTVKGELEAMLCWLDSFLRDNDIKYTIMSGTLLGAVRHGGFIPWDDDIDIGLLRSDYEKLLQVAKNYQDSKYEFQGFEINGMGRPFLKLINRHIAVAAEGEADKYLWIDIFPFDGVPDVFSNIYQFYFHKVIRNLRSTKNADVFAQAMQKQKNPFKRLYNYVLRCILPHHSEDDVTRIIIEQAKKVDIDKCANIEDIVWGMKKFPKCCMDEMTDYKFETITVRGMKDYDTYLKCIYGDYMKLPPEEQRVNHGIKAWRVVEDEE